MGLALIIGAAGCQLHNSRLLFRWRESVTPESNWSLVTCAPLVPLGKRRIKAPLSTCFSLPASQSLIASVQRLSNSNSFTAAALGGWLKPVVYKQSVAFIDRVSDICLANKLDRSLIIDLFNRQMSLMKELKQIIFLKSSIFRLSTSVALHKQWPGSWSAIR